MISNQLDDSVTERLKQERRARERETVALAPVDSPSFALLPAQVEQFLERVLAWTATIGTAHDAPVTRLFNSSAVIANPEQYRAVGELLRDVAERRKLIVETFAPFKRAADRLHKLICARENELTKPLAIVEAQGKANIVVFEREQARLRRDEEERIAARAQEQERERLAREAERLELRGEPALASAVLEQAITVRPPVVVLPAPERLTGISTGENWKWRPIPGRDPVDLVPRCFLMLDEKKLNAYAKANKGSGAVPGIEFYDAGKVSVRA